MSKKSIILHLDSLEILKELNNEQKGILFEAIYQYNLGNEIELDFAMKIAFLPFKNQFKRDTENYNKITESNSMAGRIGNLKRWNKDLYLKVIDNQITIDEAESIAKSRKESQIIADATNVSQSIANNRLNKNKNKSKNNNINKDLLLSDYLKSEKKYPFISVKEEVLMKWFLSALCFKGEYFEKSMKLKTSYESLKLLTNVDKVTNSDLCLLIGFIAHASKLKIDNVHLKNIKSISYLTKEESNNDIKRWRSLIESAKEQYAKNKEFKGNIDSMIENLNKYE
jgi:hypothetical protein